MLVASIECCHLRRHLHRRLINPNLPSKEENVKVVLSVSAETPTYSHTIYRRFAVAVRDGGARVTVSETVAAAVAEEKRKRVGEGEEGRREKVMRGLAEEIRGMAEKYVGVEEVKMQMVRETERWRLDMERKSLDLIIDSQRKLVDSIAKAFGS